MRCHLKTVLGARSGCDYTRCVFWHPESGSLPSEDTSGCVLDRFELVGAHPDRLARWLMVYKLTHEIRATNSIVGGHLKRRLSLG